MLPAAGIARWELDQTAVRASNDGSVTVMALAAGDRVAPARTVMSFIVPSEVTIVGMFSQNGFRTIRTGADVTLVFDNDPGRLHHGRITEIIEGVGQGQIAVSGTLAKTTAIGGTSVFLAAISIPPDVDAHSLRLGMSATATVFAKNAGVIGLIASILIWISAYTAYL